MSSTASLPKPNARGSSESKKKDEASSEDGGKLQQQALFAGDRLEFDLVAQLSHMSGLSTAGYGRDKLFDVTSRLPYNTSGFFRSVRLLTSRLGYDYPEACEVVANRTKNTAMRSFLLRFAGSLSSGEKEGDFLARETEVQFEDHKNKYERDLETLQKWTDGFVALEVSIALIVIISVVSMMIFPMGSMVILGLCFVGMMIAGVGAWIIFRSAPAELFTHNLPNRSALQLRVTKLAKILLPAGLLVSAGVFFALGSSAFGFLALGAFIFPVGFLANRYHSEVNGRDRDSAPFFRALGGVTAAIGSTPTEAIGRIDLRSLGSLQPDVERLHQRLKGGISPDACWNRFAAETGSELIRRTTSIFWDGIRAGGEAGRVGFLSSRFAMHLHLLRAKRALVAGTFGWLMMPMHLVLVTLLSFITEIFGLFSGEIIKAQSTALAQGPGVDAATASQIPTSNLIGFGALDMSFVRSLILIVVLTLTVVNGFVTNAAAGGDRYRLFYTTGIMSILSGLTLLIVPIMADVLFGGIV